MCGEISDYNKNSTLLWINHGFGGQIVHLVSRKGGKFYLWKNDKNKVKLNLTEKIYQRYIYLPICLLCKLLDQCCLTRNIQTTLGEEGDHRRFMDAKEAPSFSMLLCPHPHSCKNAERKENVVTFLDDKKHALSAAISEI